MRETYRFIKACQGKPVDRIPVWLMRQAGRYLPEYRELRRRFSFLSMCKTPELAQEATHQPLDRFGLDAAILFSDILVLVEAMDIELSFGEQVGPQLGRTIRNKQDVESLFVPDPEEKLGYVMAAIRLLRGSLEGRVPLIGFSGAPFTLATYMIEGGSSRNFLATKSFMYQDPSSFHRLMETLSRAVEEYLKAQIAAGAQAVQVFDTWASILSPADYREYILPHMQRLFEGINGQDVPTLHYSRGASMLLEEMAQIGAHVLSLDWRIDIEMVRKRLGPDLPVQGNLDPFALFQPPEKLSRTIQEILAKGSQWPGYIFNLGHGIQPQTPIEGVKCLVETVNNFDISIE